MALPRTVLTVTPRPEISPARGARLSHRIGPILTITSPEVAPIGRADRHKPTACTPTGGRYRERSGPGQGATLPPAAAYHAGKEQAGAVRPRARPVPATPPAAGPSAAALGAGVALCRGVPCPAPPYGRVHGDTGPVCRPRRHRRAAARASRPTRRPRLPPDSARPRLPPAPLGVSGFVRHPAGRHPVVRHPGRGPPDGRAARTVPAGIRPAPSHLGWRCTVRRSAPPGPGPAGPVRPLRPTGPSADAANAGRRLRRGPQPPMFTSTQA
jgi:hypothetical protein